MLNLITFNIFIIMLPQCCRKNSARKDHNSLFTLKSDQMDKTQSSGESLSVAKEEDSFSRKTPIKRLAKRSMEIRLKAPVDREREEYKTFTDIKLPMSDADLEK